MNKKHSGFSNVLIISVISILLLALIGEVSYILYTKSKSDNQTSTSQIATINTTPKTEKGTTTSADNTSTNTAGTHTNNPIIKVLTPNGGEFYHTGDTMTISWEANNLIENSIEIVAKRIGETQNILIANSIPNTGTYDWHIPSTIALKLQASDPDSALFVIRISTPNEQGEDNIDNIYTDTSDSPFIITKESAATSGWKKYVDSAFSFEFPSNISLHVNAGNSGTVNDVTLNHSISYSHPDFCDFKGTSKPLSEITDFNVSFKIINGNLADYLGEQAFNQILKNTYTTPTLTGYHTSAGAEGCGEDVYYFPISPEKILAVTRAFVSEFDATNSGRNYYLAQPGVIQPAQNDALFANILNTLKLSN